MLSRTFDPAVWAAVPFHFWSFVFFVFGSMVGSFLNVCIHRMPLEQSVVSPPSHCPYCKYSIPMWLNVPLITWLYLGGKCKNCGAPISIRYFLVELLTGVTFLACWLIAGHISVLLALAYALFLSGLIAATFIDFEHFIIPDEITIGGMVVGFICSLVVPQLHGTLAPGVALKASLLGMAAGAGIIYLILRAGKLLFGRQKLEFPPDSTIVFTETSILLPGEEVPYYDVFYRDSDAILLRASRVEMVDRCYRDVELKLTTKKLRIGDDEFDPAAVLHMEAMTGEIVLPREAMGLGDVKFMGAIGAFLGWQAVIFSLFVSSLIGSLVGLGLIIAKRKEWSSRLPYGPYIAAAAALWVFAGPQIVRFWFLMGQRVYEHLHGG